MYLIYLFISFQPTIRFQPSFDSINGRGVCRIPLMERAASCKQHE